MRLRLQLGQPPEDAGRPAERRLLVRGHVVDVAQEQQVTARTREVVEQRSMAAGAEHQLALRVAEGSPVGIAGETLRLGSLRRDPEVEALAEPSADRVRAPPRELAQPRLPFGRRGEVDVRHVPCVGHDRARVDQVLLERGARPFGRVVEQHQRLGRGGIAEALGAEQGVEDGPRLARGAQPLERQPARVERVRQGVMEGEARQRLENAARGAGLDLDALLERGDQVLEHARGGSRSGHEAAAGQRPPRVPPRPMRRPALRPARCRPRAWLRAADACGPSRGSAARADRAHP